MLGGFHEKLESWCTDSLAKLEHTDFRDILKQLNEAPKHNSSIVALGNISFTALTVGELLTDKVKKKYILVTHIP